MHQYPPSVITIILTAFSGVVGALIGVAAAFLLARWNRHIEAKAKLRLLVLGNGYDIYYGLQGQQFYDIFRRDHVQIKAAYFELRSLTYARSRKTLDNAWKQYNGMPYYNEIPDKEAYKLFMMGSPQTKEEALIRIRDFVNFLTPNLFSL
jgi:hypothetical protein